MILRCRPVFSGLRNRSMPSFLLPLRFCPAAARPRNHPVESGGAHQRPTGSRSEITPFSFWSVLSAGANQCRGRSVDRVYRLAQKLTVRAKLKSGSIFFARLHGVDDTGDLPAERALK